MNINYHKVRDVTVYSGAITEPVTVQEVKDYIRLTGFVDVDESPSTDLSDFNFDDDLIADIITAVREGFEQELGVSLIPKTLSAVITNQCGMIEIPMGPVADITSLKDNAGNDLTYTLVGDLGDFPNLKYPCHEDMVMVYEAGYGNTDCPAVPKAIKLDMLKACYWHYENRGDVANVGTFISSVSKRFMRKTWL